MVDPDFNFDFQIFWDFSGVLSIHKAQLVWTVKTLKIGTPEKIAVIILKLVEYHFTAKWFVQKMQTEWGNSVDPDLGVHCLPRPVCPKT